METNLLRLLVILLGVAAVAIILIQQPKEGGMGAFGGGGGASASVFGAKGATSFFFKITAVFITLFIVAILALVKVSNAGAESTLAISGTTTKTEAKKAPEKKVVKPTAKVVTTPAKAEVTAETTTPPVVNESTNTQTTDKDKPSK